MKRLLLLILLMFPSLSWGQYGLMQKPMLGSYLDTGNPLANGLVGCWMFNEETGTLVNDLSGNGLNGVITGAVWSLGSEGSSLAFDGSGDYVNLGKGRQLSAFTILAWCKNVSYNSSTKEVLTRADYGSPYERNYRFRVAGYNELSLTSYASGGAQTAGLQLSGLYANSAAFSTVKMIGVRFDGAATFVYNGNVYAPSSGSVTTVGNPVTNPRMLIGIESDYVTSAFAGVMEQVLLYNRVLSTSEIASIYHDPGQMIRTQPDWWPYGIPGSAGVIPHVGLNGLINWPINGALQ